MSTLHTFGCSYTEDYHTALPPEKFKNDRTNTYFLYQEYCGGTLPDTWPIILSKKIGYDLINYGKSAASNQEIFQTFCKYSHEIKKGDMVIFEWTYNHRYRWADEHNKTWTPMGAGSIGKSMAHCILESTHEEIVINREHPFYIDEIYERQNLLLTLSKAVGFDIYFWSVDYRIINNLPDDERVNQMYLCSRAMEQGQSIFDLIRREGGKIIKEETDGTIDDFHLAGSGHSMQAEMFYKHLKENWFF